MIEQGAVKVDDKRIENINFVISKNRHIIQVGKRRFWKYYKYQILNIFKV